MKKNLLETQILTNGDDAPYKVIETNQVLQWIGKWNKMRLLWWIVLGIIKSLATTFSMLSFIFAGGRPTEQRCQIPENATVNESIPMRFELHQMRRSMCYQYKNFSFETNETEPCTDGYHYVSLMGNTTVTEWDLVCDRDWLSEFTTSSFFAASFIGALLFSNLVDRFGRKPLFLLLLLLLNVATLAHAASPNVWVFVILRVIAGSFQQGMYIAAYCYIVELFPVEMRSFVGILDQSSWVFSCLVLSLVGYYVRDWRMFHIVTTVPFAICVPLVCLMPESIPWLIAKNRQEDAKKVIKTMCKWEKNVNPDDLDKVQIVHSVEQENTEKKVVYNIGDMLCHRRMWFWICIHIITWFVTCVMFYGMAISVIQTSDPYLAFALSSLVELPAYILTIPLAQKLGRRTITSVFASMGGICYLLAYFANSIEKLRLGILLLGRFGAAGMFAVIFLYITEMFPTTLRTTATGLGTASARIGATLAPFILYIDRSVAYGSVAVLVPPTMLAAILILCLPETVHRKLPETIEEIDEWQKDETLCRLYGGRHDRKTSVISDGTDAADEIIYRPKKKNLP